MPMAVKFGGLLVDLVAVFADLFLSKCKLSCDDEVLVGHCVCA
jgi:hypothetical protein